MVKTLLKNPLFMIGFCFIVLVLIASIIHWLVFDSYVPKVLVLFKNGKAFASPLPPSLFPPLGTTKMGHGIFLTILMGAKFTIGVALVVAALRMFFSIVIGVLYGNFFMRINRYVSKVVDAFHYLPIALLAYMVLRSVLMSNPMTGLFQYNAFQRVGFELGILTLIALPTTALLIGNETHQVLKEEFIEGVKIMGAGRFHIIRKHILPHLAPRFIIQYIQQVIQVLILLIYLGVLGLFFGGTLDAGVSLTGE